MDSLSSFDMTDEQLVKGCLSQNASAQKALYEKFSRKMFGVCLRYSENREEAEDLLQEGFLKVYLNLSSYKGSGSLEGWIRKVIVNMAIEHFRKQKLSWSGEEVSENKAGDDQIMENIEARELVKIIHDLPKGFRTVFNLYAIEGYTHKEIGELLGISENTSKSQYSRARAQLAERVNRHYQDSTNTVHP